MQFTALVWHGTRDDDGTPYATVYFTNMQGMLDGLAFELDEEILDLTTLQKVIDNHDFILEVYQLNEFDADLIPLT